MQIKKEQLQRQQMIMTVLGYYNNPCDGIWGPASIAAKKRWEMSREFVPGLPNTGMPLSEDSVYPKGVILNAKDKMFEHALLTQEKIAELMPKVPHETVAPEPVAPVVHNTLMPAVVEQPVSVEQPVVVESEEESTEADDVEQTSASPNPNRFVGNKHKRR